MATVCAPEACAGTQDEHVVGQDNNGQIHQRATPSNGRNAPPLVDHNAQGRRTGNNALGTTVPAHVSARCESSIGSARPRRKMCLRLTSDSKTHDRSNRCNLYISHPDLTLSHTHNPEAVVSDPRRLWENEAEEGLALGSLGPELLRTLPRRRNNCRGVRRHRYGLRIQIAIETQERLPAICPRPQRVRSRPLTRNGCKGALTPCIANICRPTVLFDAGGEATGSPVVSYQSAPNVPLIDDDNACFGRSGQCQTLSANLMTHCNVGRPRIAPNSACDRHEWKYTCAWRS